MVGSTSSQTLPSWMGAAASRVDSEGNISSSSGTAVKEGREDTSQQQHRHSNSLSSSSNGNLNFGERALSAAGAAFFSAILVNPLDVAKTRLQAQAAGVPYQALCPMSSFNMNIMLPDLRCSTSNTRVVLRPGPMCPRECSQYKGTLDVFYKVIRQEGFSRLWRGTNASLALAVPTVGIYLPCYDILRNFMEELTEQNILNLRSYVPLVAGSVARSLACITCYPIELARTRMQAFGETQTGVKPPGVCRTLLGVINPIGSSNILQNLFLDDSRCLDRRLSVGISLRETDSSLIEGVTE